MKSVQGKCNYCGQYQAIEVPDSYTEAEIDEEVTKRCNCPDAEAKTKIEENIACTEGAIKDFFKDKQDLDILKQLLLASVRPLAEHKISKISIAKGGYTGSMKPTKEGIKIYLKYTMEDSVEA